MNSTLQLFSAVLFLLWDRCRLLRGAWRRGEWRNACRHSLWLSVALSLIGCALGFPLWILWTIF